MNNDVNIGEHIFIDMLKIPDRLLDYDQKHHCGSNKYALVKLLKMGPSNNNEEGAIVKDVFAQVAAFLRRRPRNPGVTCVCKRGKHRSYGMWYLLEHVLARHGFATSSFHLSMNNNGKKNDGWWQCNCVECDPLVMSPERTWAHQTAWFHWQNAVKSQ